MRRDRLSEKLRLKSIEKFAEDAKKLRRKKPVGSGSNSQSSSSFSGLALDGPISGASVYAVNEDQYTTTNEWGEFTFPFTPRGEIQVYGGTDISTGLPFDGLLRSSTHYKTISVISTAIREMTDIGFSKSEAEAAFFSFIRNVLFIPHPIEKQEYLLNTNFLELTLSGDRELVTGVAILTLLEMNSFLIGLAADAYQETNDIALSKSLYFQKLAQEAKSRMGNFNNLNYQQRTQILKSLVDPGDVLQENEITAIKEELDDLKTFLLNLMLEDGQSLNYVSVNAQAILKRFKTQMPAKITSTIGKPGQTVEKIKTGLGILEIFNSVDANDLKSIGSLSKNITNITSNPIAPPKLMSFSLNQNDSTRHNQEVVFRVKTQSGQADQLLQTDIQNMWNRKVTYRLMVNGVQYLLWWNSELQVWDGSDSPNPGVYVQFRQATQATPFSPIGEYIMLDTDLSEEWNPQFQTQITSKESSDIIPGKAIFTITTPSSWELQIENPIRLRETAQIIFQQDRVTATSSINRNDQQFQTVSGTFREKLTTGISGDLSFTLKPYGTNKSYTFNGTFIPNNPITLIAV